MLKKLRLKFILTNMLIIFVMLCIIFTMLFLFTRSSLEQESKDAMERLVSGPGQMALPNGPSQNVPFSYILVQLGNSNQVLTVSTNWTQTPDNAYISSIVNQALAANAPNGYLQESDLRFHVNKGPMGQSLIFADTSREQAALRFLLQSFILVGIMALAVFFGISALLAWWAVKPVEKAWQQQKQFVSDASHELKTPLTVIMTNAELLQNPEYDDENRKQFSSSILTMSKQMQRLVEQMLTLARTDHLQKQNMQAVDFSKLVYDAVLPFEPVFFEKDLSLQTQIAAGICVNGENTQLRQVLDILLDNAQKYSAAGGTTFVSLASSGRNKCLLTVANQGIPMTPEQLRNIFKRFYRADDARTRNGSFGLGLSIAHNIVAQHQGRIWATSKDGINQFFVELPLQ